MIKANSFGDYFALLCHESTCLSEKGKRLSVSRVFTFRHSGSALSVRASHLFLSTPIGADRSSPTGVRKAQSQVRRIQPGFSLSSRVASSMRDQRTLLRRQGRAPLSRKASMSSVNRALALPAVLLLAGGLLALRPPARFQADTTTTPCHSQNAPGGRRAFTNR